MTRRSKCVRNIYTTGKSTLTRLKNTQKIMRKNLLQLKNKYLIESLLSSFLLKATVRCMKWKIIKNNFSVISKCTKIVGLVQIISNDRKTLISCDSTSMAWKMKFVRAFMPSTYFENLISCMDLSCQKNIRSEPSCKNPVDVTCKICELRQSTNTSNVKHLATTINDALQNNILLVHAEDVGVGSQFSLLWKWNSNI